MPPGADAILPIERCDVGDGEVTLTAPVRQVRSKQGENLRKGAAGLFAEPTSRLRRSASAPPWAIRRSRWARLRVAVIPTGDELRPAGEPLRHGEVYESNSHGLVGLVRGMGHEPYHHPAVEDTLEGLRKALDAAAEASDMIVTSGGVSMGEWDLVRPHGRRRRPRYWRVKIRPDRPLRVVERNPSVWFARKPCEQPRGVPIAGGRCDARMTGATGPIETTVRAGCWTRSRARTIA